MAVEAVLTGIGMAPAPRLPPLDLLVPLPLPPLESLRADRGAPAEEMMMPPAECLKGAWAAAEALAAATEGEVGAE